MKLEDILNDHHLNSQFSKVINSPFIDSEDTKKKYISKLEDFESEEIADILDFSKCFFNHKDMESVIIGHPFILDYFKGYYNCYKLAPTKFKDQSVNIMVNLSKNLHSFKLRSDSGLSFFESSLSVLKDPFEDPDLFHNPKDIEIYFNLLEQYSKEGVLPLAKGLMGNITVYLNNGYNYATLDKLVNNIGQIEKRASSTVSFAFLNGISTLALPIFYQDCGSKFKNIFNREMMDIYFNKINEFSTCSENQAFVFARDFPSVAQFKNKFIEHYIKMMEYLRDNGYEIIESSSPFPDNFKHSASFNFTDLEDSQIPQFIDDVIFSTNMLGYLDQEFVDGYVDLLLEKDLSKKQKRMVQNTKDIIFEQRQKLKNSKQEVSLGLSYQQPDSGEDGDNHYGKPHFIEGKYLNIEGDSFLIARHDFDSPEALYSSDGEMTNLFGSPHESIREMIEFNCQKFIIAQHETLGSFNFYSLDGEIADLFGASHNNVWDFVEIEGEMLLKAEHRQGMWALYSIDGKNKWFGRDHAFIYSDVIDSFVEFEGQKFVKDTAIQGNRPILYSIDGFYFEGEDSVKVSKYGVPKLYDKTYFTMKDWLWQEKNPLHGMSIEIIEKISDYNLLDQSINLFGSDCDNMLDSLTDIFRDSGLFDYWLSIVDKFSKDGKNKLDLSESINVAKKTYSLKERFMEVSNFNMNLKEGSTDSLTELGELVTMKMGDYQVLRVIGEGAEGIVYQAKHDILGDVKLKIFKDPEDKIKEAIEKEGVTLEERIQARMMNLDDIEDMKYITRFKGLGTCKNPRTNKKTLYLTLEYIDGGAVEIMGATDYSIREDIKLQDINSIYSKFLDGLEVIHNAGKILKDVKLRNILVSYDHKKVKIDDLETISGIDEVQQGKRITCGSDRYAAPEALTDIINATQQSDLYSSAICLLYMKTRNPTLMLGINDILEPDEYTLKLNDMLSKQNLSKSQEEFFNKALAYSPCNRYQSVSEMKSESQDLF